MSTEEFVACLIFRGFTVADFDKFSYGMLINYCNEYDRCQRRANGEKVADTDKQYKQLKKIMPLIEQKYKNGEISQKQYDNYIKSLDEYEGR